MTLVTRFAPSPNGFLHVGHALSAIIAHDAARMNGGRFLLRIEDIDLDRRRPEYISAIYEDLSWLGLTWEEPVLVQSEHFKEYLAAADRLIAMGLLYPCFATRSEILATASPEKTDPEGMPLYPGIMAGGIRRAGRRAYGRRRNAGASDQYGWRAAGPPGEARRPAADIYRSRRGRNAGNDRG